MEKAVPSIREALDRFLAETGKGKPGSLASPSSIIELFARYLNEYAHEDLNEFERARFDKEYEEGRRFCDVFDAHHIKPFHLSFFLNTFVIRKVMSTKGFLKACGPVMEKLACWLAAQGHWDDRTRTDYREIVGEDAGKDLIGCDALATALHRFVESHPVEESDVDDEDFLGDQLTIKYIEFGSLIFDGLIEGDDDIVVSLPRSVTSKAKAGWSVTLEMARIKGRWRILSVGNVYP